MSSHETVQDIRQVVLDRQESCFRTCISLHLDGKRLDDFAELHSVEGLKDDSVIKILEGTLSISRRSSVYVVIYCHWELGQLKRLGYLKQLEI